MIMVSPIPLLCAQTLDDSLLIDEIPRAYALIERPATDTPYLWAVAYFHALCTEHTYRFGYTSPFAFNFPREPFYTLPVYHDYRAEQQALVERWYTLNTTFTKRRRPSLYDERSHTRRPTFTDTWTIDTASV